MTCHFRCLFTGFHQMVSPVFSGGFTYFPSPLQLKSCFFNCLTCHGEGDCATGKGIGATGKNVFQHLNYHVPSESIGFLLPTRRAIISVKRRQKTAPVTSYLHVAMLGKSQMLSHQKCSKMFKEKVYLKEKVSMLGNMSSEEKIHTYSSIYIYKYIHIPFHSTGCFKWIPTIGPLFNQAGGCVFTRLQERYTPAEDSLRTIQGPQRCQDPLNPEPSECTDSDAKM